MSKKLAYKSHFGYYSDYNNTNIYDTYNYSFHAKLKYGVKRWSSGADIHFYPFSWLFFKTGAKVQANNNDVNWDISWRNYIELPTQINFNAQYMHNSAYWQTRLRFLKQVEYSMGLRYDYSTL